MKFPVPLSVSLPSPSFCLIYLIIYYSCSTVMYCTALFFSLLHSTVQYSNILYYALLYPYCTIFSSVVLVCNTLSTSSCISSSSSSSGTGSPPTGGSTPTLLYGYGGFGTYTSSMYSSSQPRIILSLFIFEISAIFLIYLYFLFCFTLLYIYVEISLTPSYAAVVGAGWLEKGGCYVSANIRGGGEFGPQWHQAAKKENR